MLQVDIRSTTRLPSSAREHKQFTSHLLYMHCDSTTKLKRQWYFAVFREKIIFGHFPRYWVVVLSLSLPIGKTTHCFLALVSICILICIHVPLFHARYSFIDPSLSRKAIKRGIYQYSPIFSPTVAKWIQAAESPLLCCSPLLTALLNSKNRRLRMFWRGCSPQRDKARAVLHLNNSATIAVIFSKVHSHQKWYLCYP